MSASKIPMEASKPSIAVTPSPLLTLLPILLLALAFSSAESSACYTAEVAQWTWCSGYEAVGYTCLNGFCSADKCIGSCAQCADVYSNASFDKNAARCCASRGPSGQCNGPLPGDAPYNAPYGFPNKAGGEIVVEGPVPYPNGPPSWSNTTQGGAVGWTAFAPSAATDGGCPAPDTSGAWLPPRGLKPISLEQHGEPLGSCFLACNISEVARTGVDPCNAGSIFGDSAAPSLIGVYANYSCYFGGANWIHPADIGVCGFNCTAHDPHTGALCDAEDMAQNRCLVYCDSRAIPH